MGLAGRISICVFLSSMCWMKRELPDSFFSTAWSYCWEQIHVWKRKQKGTDKQRSSYVNHVERHLKDKHPRSFLSGKFGEAIIPGLFSHPAHED